MRPDAVPHFAHQHPFAHEHPDQSMGKHVAEPTGSGQPPVQEIGPKIGPKIGTTKAVIFLMIFTNLLSKWVGNSPIG